MGDVALILMMAVVFAAGGFAISRFCVFMDKTHKDSHRW